MGILDDAIREHLELKRSHGAPEEELRRQEVEALGVAHDEAIRENEDVDATRLAAEEQAPAVDDIPEPEPEPDRRARAAAAPEFEQPAPDFDPGALAAEEPEFETRAEVEPLEEPAPAEPEAPPRRHSDTPTQGFDALAEDDEPFDDEPPPPPAEGTEEAGRPGPAGGHARLSRGDAGARPALVRAAPSARLRLRLSTATAQGGAQPGRRPGEHRTMPSGRMSDSGVGARGSCGGGRPPRRPPH